MPIQTSATIVAAHEAIDKLVTHLQADAREHIFQMDALSHMNRELTASNARLRNALLELQAETARLQAEIEGKAALPNVSVKAPRKKKAPKPPEAPAPVDPDAP